MQINLSINIFFLISEENLYKDFQTDRLGQGLTHTHTQISLRLKSISPAPPLPVRPSHWFASIDLTFVCGPLTTKC